MMLPRPLRYRLWQWQNAVEVAVDASAAREAGRAPRVPTSWRKEVLGWLYVILAMVIVFPSLIALAWAAGIAFRAVT